MTFTQKQANRIFTAILYIYSFVQEISQNQSPLWIYMANFLIIYIGMKRK